MNFLLVLRINGERREGKKPLSFPCQLKREWESEESRSRDFFRLLGNSYFVYIYKNNVYSCGHPYMTSSIWVFPPLSFYSIPRDFAKKSYINLPLSLSFSYVVNYWRSLIFKRSELKSWNKINLFWIYFKCHMLSSVRINWLLQLGFKFEKPQSIEGSTQIANHNVRRWFLSLTFFHGVQLPD